MLKPGDSVAQHTASGAQSGAAQAALTGVAAPQWTSPAPYALVGQGTAHAKVILFGEHSVVYGIGAAHAFFAHAGHCMAYGRFCAL